MQHCAGSYSVFNPVSREWERRLTYQEAARREAEYLAMPNSGAEYPYPANAALHQQRKGEI